MSAVWTPLRDIPAHGREFSFNDAEFWKERLQEFHVSVSDAGLLRADVNLLPQSDGVLVSGRLSGELTAPCDRCAEKAAIKLDAGFEEFEPYPDADQAQQPDDSEAEKPEPTFIRQTKAGYELDVAGLVWEQFVLALPVKPLCKESCRGLCPLCGANMNTTPCSCYTEELDPRMAPLRGIKVARKQ